MSLEQDPVAQARQQLAEAEAVVARFPDAVLGGNCTWTSASVHEDPDRACELIVDDSLKLELFAELTVGEKKVRVHQRVPRWGGTLRVDAYRVLDALLKGKYGGYPPRAAIVEAACGIVRAEYADERAHAEERARQRAAQ